MLFRIRYFLVMLILAMTVLGCRKAQTPTADAEPELTPDQAKVALLELVRTTKLDDMPKAHVERYASKAVAVRENGKATWGSFSFDLKAKRYSYIISRGEGDAKAVLSTKYEGTFEYRQGKWIAVKPQ